MVRRGLFSFFRVVEAVLAGCTIILVTGCEGDGGNVGPEPVATATTITGDTPDPSMPGQPVQVTVGVTSQAGTPTGDVTVSVVGGNESCSGALSNGTITCGLALGTEGTQILEASYSGNPSFLPSSDTEEHVVAVLPSGVGQIRITTTTTGSSQDADGYQYSVDGGQSQAIGVNASAMVSGLAAGSHVVVLSGISANCAVPGGTSREVTVTAGGTAAVAFNVSCSPLPAEVGSIRVTTMTSGSDPDSNGYQLSVDGGQSQSVASNATSTIGDIPAGTHLIQLSEVAGNCTAANGSSRTVSVSPGVAAVVNFSVTCTALPPTAGITSLLVQSQAPRPNRNTLGSISKRTR
jgi:hypothetical protein